MDILVELTGHTANNRLGIMAKRPAPVQVSAPSTGLTIKEISPEGMHLLRLASGQFRPRLAAHPPHP